MTGIGVAFVVLVNLTLMAWTGWPQIGVFTGHALHSLWRRTHMFPIIGAILFIVGVVEAIRGDLLLGILLMIIGVLFGAFFVL